MSREQEPQAQEAPDGWKARWRKALDLGEGVINYWRTECDAAIERAEAAERGAAEQRALAEWQRRALVLAYANIGQENWARMTDRAKNTIINNVQLAEAQARPTRPTRPTRPKPLTPA